MKRVAWWLCVALFVAQFAVMDVAWRGAHAFVERPLLVLALGESVLLWSLARMLATTRARRIGVAALAAFLIVLQALVLRFYRVPLDVQVAASALHAFRDVKPVLVAAAPRLLASLLFAVLVEFALLELPVRLAQTEPSWSRKRRAILAAAAFAGLLLTSPRQATPDVRAIHALTALREPQAGPRVSAVSLPPLYSERSALPSVLVILTESVRAEDYVVSGAGATAPETAAATPHRVDFAEMRAVSSYTAVSLSAILTGRSQEGKREEILRAPNLFDFAHAVRDPAGAKPLVAYLSVQSETVFETRDVRAGVDRFFSVETLLGRADDDEKAIVEFPLDQMLTKRFEQELATLPHPSVVVLHLVSTHAPYWVDPDHAPFKPYDHVATWAGMPELRNAYRDAIFEQDRNVAQAVRAFIAHAGRNPWVIAFTSDHGEAFGEHGAIHHGQNLHDEQVHVPAWILAGQGAITDVEQRALEAHRTRFLTHLDLLPTLLDVLGLWDNVGVRDYRAAMRGHSLLRAPVPRAAIPVTNCTGMFPCPLNTWGLLEEDHKLMAHLWGGDWACLQLGVTSADERVADPRDPACERLRSASRQYFPLLPNGAPNR